MVEKVFRATCDLAVHWSSASDVDIRDIYLKTAGTYAGSVLEEVSL